MGKIWQATKKDFGKWHLETVKAGGGGRLMTLKKRKVKYNGKSMDEEQCLVRFFNTKAAAIKEAQRINAGGKMREKDELCN